jgi:hypothetical protein
MEHYKNEAYIENRKPVDKKYNQILVTPINEKYSALIYAKIEEKEMIHGGGYFSSGIHRIEVGTESGERQFFAQKNSSFEKAKDYLINYNLIKKAGLPTFDEAFILNGKYFITTLLNNNEEVVLAINFDDRNFPINTDKNNFKEIFKNKLKIKDFSELVDDIFDQIINAYQQHKLYIGLDTLFFRTPINHQGQEVELKWLIGDLDFIYSLNSNIILFTGLSFFRAIKILEDTLIEFINFYCDNEVMEDYQKIIKKKSIITKMQT